MYRKVCFKCNIEKDITEYYKHPKMADGHLGKCKECNKRDVTLNRDDKLEYYRHYDKSRMTEERRLKVNLNNRLMKIKFPIKNKARYSLSNSIRDGLVIKPTICEHCKLPGKIHGHHWSYKEENWLNVIWLCSGCHGREHSRLKREGIEIEY